MKNTFIIAILLLTLGGCTQKEVNKVEATPEELMIRIAEIEIHPEHLDEYLTILKEESKASVEKETGVISIYPMYQKENPSQIRILEIYQNRKAYESHLETPHFKHYKSTTLNMVKSLKLIEMDAIDAETMPMIFQKVSFSK